MRHNDECKRNIQQSFNFRWVRGSCRKCFVAKIRLCFFFLIFFENYQKFLKFWKFSKKSNFRKNFQTSKCSKKFAFWVMIKQKKLQRDFLTNFTILKKFLARAKSHIAVKTQKSWNFSSDGRIFWARARESARAPKIFLESKSS